MLMESMAGSPWLRALASAHEGAGLSLGAACTGDQEDPRHGTPSRAAAEEGQPTRPGLRLQREGVAGVGSGSGAASRAKLRAVCGALEGAAAEDPAGRRTLPNDQIDAALPKLGRPDRHNRPRAPLRRRLRARPSHGFDRCAGTSTRRGILGRPGDACSRCVALRHEVACALQR